MEDGTFKAVLSSNQRPTQLKALTSKSRARREPTSAERAALQASTFEDEGITWKVLKVQWDDGLDSIIVFYYDYDAAKNELLDEDELHEDHEYVEHSSLEEVLKWTEN